MLLLSASIAFPVRAQSTGPLVSLDDGSIVVAAGSSVTHRYSAGEKVLPLFVGLGYGYGGDTFDSAALGLASITADGKPNAHFGRNGRVITPLRPANNHDAAVATALLRDARGRLIIVGWRTQSIWPDAGITLISAARYDASGTLDPTFGDRGLINVRLDRDAITEPTTAALDGQGRLVVAGLNGGKKLRTKLGSFDDWANHLFVARFTAEGTLDASFGHAGFATADVAPAPPKETVNPNCKQTYETCVWLHKKVLEGHEREFLVYGHDPAGLAIDSRSRLVAGASASDGTFLLARFLPDGNLDTTFGRGGTVRTPMSAGSSIAQIVCDRAGRLLVVGSAGDRIALLRYTADGILDTTFGTAGIRETPFARELTASAALLTPDGHLFVAAYGQQRLAIGLFEPDGTPVKDFGQSGILSAAVTNLTGPAGLMLNVAGEPTVAAWSEDGVAMLRANRSNAPK